MTVADPRVAARAALAGWLKARLPDVDVSENWPTPGKPLKMPAVTVTVSDRAKVMHHRPTVTKWQATSAKGDKVATTYTYGYVEFNLQLDCWESFEARRDDLMARVGPAVHVPPEVSLGIDTRLRCGHAPGLVLAMPAYFDSLVEFIFDDLPAPMDESSSSAQVGEWRAGYPGMACLYITNQEIFPALRTAIAIFNGERMTLRP